MPAEGRQGVFGDRDEEVTAPDTEDDLEVVEEAFGCLGVAELVRRGIDR